MEFANKIRTKQMSSLSTALVFLSVILASVRFIVPVSAASHVKHVKIQPPIGAYEVEKDATASSVSLQWRDNGNPAGTLYRISDNGNPGDNCYLTPTTTANLSAVLTDLRPNVPCVFQIQAVKKNGDLTAGLPASAWSLAAAPSGVSAFGSSPSSITLEWETNNNAPGTKYTVSWKKAGSTETPMTTMVDEPFLNLKGLATSTGYDFKVTAHNKKNGFVNPISATATAFTSDQDILTPAGINLPIGADEVEKDATASSVSLLWQANGNPTGTLYRISDNGNPGDNCFLTPFTTSNTSAVLTGLLPNIPCVFQIQAIKSNGDLTAGLPASAWTLADKPADIGSFGATPHSIDLEWYGNNNSPGTKYTVSWKKVGSTETPTSTMVSEPFLNVKGLTPDTEYAFKVTAHNKKNGFVNPVSATTTLFTDTAAEVTNINPPIGAYEVEKDATPTSVSLQWQANGNPTGTLYRISDNGNPGFNCGLIPTITSNLNAVLTGLRSNVACVFQIQAIKSNGDLTVGLPASAWTLAAEPTDLSTVYSTQNSIALEWYSNKNAPGTTYTVAWKKVGSTEAPMTTTVIEPFINIKGLDSETEYSFTVTAHNKKNGLVNPVSATITAFTDSTCTEV